MSSLSTLIYYPRSIGLLASGIFAGASLAFYGVSVPAIKVSKDPLPSFVATYNRGSKLAVPNILVATIASGYCYYKTKNQRFLYSALLTFFSMPFTVFCIAPVNNKLFALQKNENYDVKHVNQLLDQWKVLQGVRAVAGVAAFVLNVFLYHQ